MLTKIVFDSDNAVVVKGSAKEVAAGLSIKGT